ncbi:MAG: ABC transporter ATP-binding protein [Acidimicrobiia bacterium]|nr:ABC transporter ATP-binding protein [Acidimicrobiia bacterium]
MSWGVAGLRVSFGPTEALDGINLEVPPGRVTAVVGGDGAGKTTLLRVMAGLVAPRAGTVRRPRQEQIGYLPTRSGGFRDLTVAENLEFVAAAARLPGTGRRADDLLERTGLAPFRKRLARDLSGGMRQKLGVVMAMLPSPAMLVLDEPTTGVDPVSRADLWRLIALAAAQGAAVLVSSAYLDEAERAAWVMVLREGRSLVAGTPAEVTASLPGAVVDVDAPTDPARAWRRGPRWREWRPNGDPTAIAPTLEDVVIVASLAAETGRAR